MVRCGCDEEEGTADHSPHPAASVSAQAHSRRQAGAFGPGPRAGQRLVPRDAAELLDWLAAGKLKPVVAERIPLAEAARAHELLERGEYAGKVVLVT